MNNIASAIVKARRSFGPALKDRNNPAFKSKYADLGACLDAVDDALLAQGIAVYQETSECADGVVVETVFLHESGETLRGGKLHVPAVKHDPQGYGSALTYARRYSLMAACGIAPEDDDGNAAAKAVQARQQQPAHGMSEKVIADYCAKFDEAATVDAITAIWNECSDKATKAKDESAYRAFRAAANKRKKALEQHA
jgi:hypothetical protein